MFDHDETKSGDPVRRRRRRLAGVALGSAVLLVTGLFQPLPLSFGPAQADDHITGPLQDVVNRNLTDLNSALTAANAAGTALSTNAQTFAAQISTIVSGAPSDPSAALSALQAASAAEATALAGTGLTQALALTTQLLAPTCSTLGSLTALLPNIGLSGVLDRILGPLAPSVDQLDNQLSTAILTYYTNAFTKLLAPISLPGGAAALQPYVTLAQALVSLLKMNWHTTYYPPNGGAPVVRDTPGLLGLPTLIDVDGRTGADVCGSMTYNTTAKTMSQSIARLPFTGTLPLDIQGQFLGNVISAGYSTKGSAAPASFVTSTNGTVTDTTLYGAGPTITQTLGLTSAVQFSLASTKPPTTYHVATSTPGGTGGSGGSGTQLNYTGSAASTHFGYAATLGPLTVGVAQTPGATSFEYCTSSKGFCSNEPAANSSTEKGSVHLLANQSVQVDQTSSPGSTTCPTLAALFDGHLTGSSLHLGYDSTASATAPGHVWVDSAGKPVSGCLATGGTVGTLPTGFQAKARNATWEGTGLAPPATAKSGTVTCPAGTKVQAGSILGFDLDRYFCFLPPVNTAPPTITAPSNHFNVGVTLTGNNGTWTPPAPNLPTFTKTWKSCHGTTCTTVANNTDTYTPSSTDQGNTLTLTVNAVNLDGSATAVSVATTAIGAAIPPNNTTKPQISGTRHVGDSLTATAGSWDQTGLTYTYQWQHCTTPGAGCTNVGSPTTTTATSATYPLAAADEGSNLQVVVTAKNPFNASGTATSNSLFVPPPPANLTTPAIQDGTNSTAPLTVLQGDNLSILNPTTYWNYADAASGGSFSYQWFSCATADNSDCTQVATSATYAPKPSDVGRYLSVTVKATNPNGSAAAAPAAYTTAVLANSLLASVPNQVPDGPVFASTPSSQGDYLGGAFDTVGPQVGGGGAVPGTPGAPSRTPSLAALVSGGTGKVNAVASDLAGGYFIGGNFDHVLGTACPGLAHITNAGTLDTTTYKCQAGLSGEVRALNYVKRASTSSLTALEVLGVAGSFTDGSAKNVMFLDPSGNASFPANQPDAAVNAMGNDSAVIDKANFFIGGAFTHLGTQPSMRLAAVSMTATQAPSTPLSLTSSNYPGGVACTTAACTTPVVTSLSVMAHTLLTSPFIFPQIIFGGSFDTVYSTDATGTSFTGATLRNNAAAISEATPGTQLVGGWNPSPNGPVTAITGVSSVLNVNATVYLAGNFTTVNNPTGSTTTAVNGLVEYGIATTTTGSPAVRTNAATSAGPGTTATSSPNTAWLPAVGGGQVLSILPGDSGVYLGGSFTSIGTAVRHRLAHVTAAGTTLSLDLWDPNAGQAVRSIARYAPSSGTPSIFVGGDYLVLGGSIRNNIAELTKAGTFTAWAPAGTAAPVHALAATATTVYAGGDVSGSAPNLVAFDTGDNNSPWSVVADGPVRALAIGPAGLYLGGDFTHVGGSANSRAHLAAVSLSGGTVSAWNPGITGGGGVTVSALAADATAVYAGGQFSQAGTTSRTNLAALDPTSGAVVTTWNPVITGAVYALALNSSTVYVGGQSGAAAVNRGDGSATGWAPAVGGPVRALGLLGASVLVGGDFGVMQVDGSTGAANATFTPNPNGPVYSISVTPSSGLVGIFGSFTNISGNPTNSYGFYGG